MAQQHLRRPERAIRAIGILLAIVLAAAPVTVPSTASANDMTPAQMAKLEEIKGLTAKRNAAMTAGRYKEALAFQQRVIAIIESESRITDPALADPVEKLGDIYAQLGDSPHAEEAYRRALAMRDQVDPDSVDAILVVTKLAALLQARSDFADARPMWERSLAFMEKNLPADDPRLASSRITVAFVDYSLHDAGAAAKLFEKVLSVFDKTLDKNDPKIASVEKALALAEDDLGDYARALPRYQRVLDIDSKNLPSTDRQIAIDLNNVADSYVRVGNYAPAEPLFQRALAMRESATPPDDLAVAIGLNNLAAYYDDVGAYDRAQPLYERALAIHEKALGADAPLVALSLVNLAGLDTDRGDYAHPEALLLRALAIYKKASPDSSEVARTLNNLGSFLDMRGFDSRADFDRAAAYVRQSLEIYEKILGPDHPDLAKVLNNAGGMFFRELDFKDAEPLLLRSLAIREKALGESHPDVASSLDSLALMYDLEDDAARSAALEERALAIYEKAFGPAHHSVATALHNLRGYRERMGAHAQALDAEERALDIDEKNLDAMLGSGSEQQKLAYAETLATDTDSVISMHTQAAPSDARAERLALTTLLRRKGRVLDAVSNGSAALRSHLEPADGALLDDLAAARTRFAAKTLEGSRGGDASAYVDDLGHLQGDVDRIEATLSARSADFRVRSAPVTIESVQTAIPEDAALVEIASYIPIDEHKNAKDARGPRRYVAYVLHHRGPPAWADLGDAAAIDDRANALRVVLADPALRDPHLAARALDERVMQPIRPLLAGARRVLLSPDGTLNLVPFAALVDERGEYLIAHASFTYLTSGRDLLRLGVAHTPRSPGLVVANADFGAISTDAPAAGGANALGFDFRRARFSPLLGTDGEATALAGLFHAATVIRAKDATKQAIVSARAPVFLHVATHGFFLDEREEHAAHGSRGLVLDDAGPTTGKPRGRVSPLLRSGLALAGANVHAPGEPGILTAFEASGLDLIGTKLVVLSACETAVGEVKNGAGVYGLRRAFVVAGAESQVMSLWKVDDDATRELMVAYYTALRAGAGRTEALREADLAMLAEPKHNHPYFWAAFIPSGDWRSLDGRDVPLADASQLEKAPHGACGCRAAGQGGTRGDGKIALLAAAILALASRWRSRHLRSLGLVLAASFAVFAAACGGKSTGSSSDTDGGDTPDGSTAGDSSADSQISTGCGDFTTTPMNVDPTLCAPQLSSTTACQGQVCSFQVEVPCLPDGGTGDGGSDECQSICDSLAPSGVPMSGFCQTLRAPDGGTSITISCGGCGI